MSSSGASAGTKQIPAPHLETVLPSKKAIVKARKASVRWITQESLLSTGLRVFLLKIPRGARRDHYFGVLPDAALERQSDRRDGLWL
jgi:hypothetical protein